LEKSVGDRRVGEDTLCPRGLGKGLGLLYREMCMRDRRVGDDTLCPGGLGKGLRLFFVEMCRGQKSRRRHPVPIGLFFADM
jgi:hypothetical protein